jgi:hypothetical protein
MSGHEGFATRYRDGDDVIKLMESQHPANGGFLAAMVAGGKSAMETYLATLRGAGITLPPDLAVISASPLAVRHRWVAGPALLDQARGDPGRLVAAVIEIVSWLLGLDPTDARIDTNLANFLIADCQIVLIDVLPPLIPSRQPEPLNLFDQLFGAMCLDTAVILRATIGYATRAMLGDIRRVTASHIDSLADLLRYEVSGQADGGFPASWFTARAELGLRGLAGEARPEVVNDFFALTSVRVFRELPETSRASRLNKVAAAMHECGLP